MKKLFFVIIVFVLVSQVNAQFSFSVKPGLSFNGASFGYKFNNIVAFVNYDYNHVGGSIEQTIQGYDYDLNSMVSVNDKSEASFSINNIGIGGKMFFPIEKSIEPYVTLVVSKPFLSADLTISGEEQNYVSDFVADINLWAFNIGVGTEYFFTNNFSIGGEFGLRAIVGSYDKDNKSSEKVYTSSGYKTYETNNKYSIDINYSITYSVISLNYYF